jgi:hypothetical protein
MLFAKSVNHPVGENGTVVRWLEQEVRKMVERANICTTKRVEERMCYVEGSFKKAFLAIKALEICANGVARRQRRREQLSLEQRGIRAPMLGPSGTTL